MFRVLVTDARMDITAHPRPADARGAASPSAASSSTSVHPRATWTCCTASHRTPASPRATLVAIAPLHVKLRRRLSTAMPQELALFKMLAAVLAIMLVLLLAVWAYRYVQYRRAVRLAQMRWLHFEASKVFTEAEAQQSLDWPSSSSAVMASMLLSNQQPAHLLSPIPEERGRDSMDSLGSARRDLRQGTASFISYGSVEAP